MEESKPAKNVETEIPVRVGTSDMPKPQTLDYNIVYKVKEEFFTDISPILRALPYADSIKIRKHFDRHGKLMPIACLNEIIRLIGSFPYKYVHGVMNVIETEFCKYFELYKPENKTENGETNGN